MAEPVDLQEQLVLTDLVNRVLDRGVTVMGDVTISVAGVDLIHLALRLDLSSIESLAARGSTRAAAPRALGPGGQ
jgi:gas vesicle structural protein